jgi:hypothetical protein
MKPHWLVLVIGWAVLATVFGLLCWATIVVVAIVFSGVSSVQTGIAGLVIAMVFATFAALVVGLPVALLLTTLWHVIARPLPHLDRNWEGIFLGSAVLALIMSSLYYSICMWAYATPYLYNSIFLFVTVTGGLLLPRKVFSWLRPSTFTR